MKPVIVGFEGYLQGSDSYVNKHIMAPLERRFKDKITTIMCPFSRQPSVENVWLTIGHSFGGDTALKFAASKKSKYVITCDPRHASPFSFLDAFFPFFKNFQSPENSQVYNFYRRGFLPGYLVEGALCNDNVGGTHWDVPSEPMILNLAHDIIYEALE